ncbi:NADPH:quinone reductase-like Zn-dependent oxidoreductase [Streptomyces sp. 840.1]|uniref:NADP-dependent oxidoreductase n=1 Tax=Streptomyces sp. 840.1 TaxID=2485152 RepID=UPI000F467B06|nr:NADP-dependent oxidoreductase [Streptomyces sp. 840.1]ROQ66598.1 NADPH:quinone reductase-like Zn-dependent oxidoreductase [Streptomyces sp. 840.1]
MPIAYVHDSFGGPEVEHFAELPRPVPGQGQLLVAVRAAGVNPVDWKRRSGRRPAGAPGVELPAVMGGEAAGEVVELGPGTTGFAVGDAVLGGPVTGGYAQYTLLPARSAVHKPPEVSWTDAAVLPIAAATGYAAVHRLGLPAGATLLVTGVAGGVGVAAAQVASGSGLTVVGSAAPAKREFAEALGIRFVASGPGLAARVAAAAPHGVDGVLDLVGGDVLEEAAALLADRTKLVSGADREAVAALGGAPVGPVRDLAILGAVVELVRTGALDPKVTRVVPFEQAPLAVRAVESGHSLGKTVLEMPPPGARIAPDVRAAE